MEISDPAKLQNRSYITLILQFIILFFTGIACNSSGENELSSAGHHTADNSFTEHQTNTSEVTNMRLTTQNDQQWGQVMAQHQQNSSIQTESAWQNQQTTGNSVVITDRGLQMPMGTYTLPVDWQVSQNIAFDPVSGRQLKYQLDMHGPNGELIRGFPYAEYGPLYGRNFDDSWKNPVMMSLNPQMSVLNFGQVRQSQRMQDSRKFRETSTEFDSQGMRLQALEVPFSGIFQGKDYTGVVYISLSEFPMMQNTGIITFSLVTAPVGIFEATLETNFQIGESFQQNPQHKQRVAQLMEQQTQQLSASNQASFNAHQQQMATMRQGFDAQNKQWSDNFFGSNWGTSFGNGYSSNDAFLDAITGHTTFDDPHSGFQIKNEGHYQYNYTDGMGNYYGTDDPSFDPSTLQGDWQYIAPVRLNN
ncbi:hypothetical protein BH23BAC3_BH23BAC3_35850 [soil metagenome]